MQGDVIAALRAEEADLQRKLAAVRGVLSVYGAVASSPASVPASTLPVLTFPPRAVGTVRMTDYGRRIRESALGILKQLASTDAPVPTTMLVDLLFDQGIEIRGQDPRNALSAILSRDPNVKSHGRSGWTLSDEALTEYIGSMGPKENEPPSDEVAGGSDTEESGDRKSPLFS